MREKLEVGDDVAEFFVNTKADPVVHHYIITPKDSPEIQAWGQTASRQDCIDEANATVKQLFIGRAARGNAS